MLAPDWLVFFERTFPSANMALVRTSRPVLFDTGFGSDLEETERLVREAGVEPRDLTLVVNSHYHSDHVGGNHGLQTRYGVPIATFRWEAELINRRDPEACAARWLDQPIEPYHIDRALDEGEMIDAGEVKLRVLHTPGHTLGHLSLYEPKEGILLAGDAVHSDDVGWINAYREGAAALDRGIETVRRLRGMKIHWGCSGHGAALEDPAAALDSALRRYTSWKADPERLAWHAMKRVFVYALMLFDGLPEYELAPYLLSCGWFRDFARHAFRQDPESFVEPMLAEMLRSKAASLREGRLVSGAPYNAPARDWAGAPTVPERWPAVIEGGD